MGKKEESQDLLLREYGAESQEVALHSWGWGRVEAEGNAIWMSSKILPTLGLRGLICWVHCTPAHSRLQAQEPHWGKCPPPGSLASHPLEWAFGAITAGGWPKHSRALTISLLTFPCPRPDRKKPAVSFNTCYLEAGKEDATTSLCFSLNIYQMPSQ